MNKELIEKTYFVLFSLIPISIIFGPAISLINILLISFVYLTHLISTKNFGFTKKPTFLILVLIYFYLIFNSFISIDFQSGIFRNFGFIRFILLFLAVNYFFHNFNRFDKVFKIWFIIIFAVVIDSFIEFIFGRNILGYGGDAYGNRIVSFFYDEPIVGAYLSGFMFIIAGYLFKNFHEKNQTIKVSILLILLLFLLCVFITGERSNTIKIFFGFFLFFYLNHNITFKVKFFCTIIFIFLVSFMLTNSDYLKLRYGDQLFNVINTKEKREVFYQKNLYFKLYKSGIEVFKNYPTFGVGNKNYRIETCDGNKNNKNYYCQTHPHQVYIELLAEHGLLGTSVFLILIFYLIFKNFKIYLNSQNFIQLGSFIYLLTNFLPLLPSGSFFSDFNSTLFWINLSIMYACNKKTNFFQKK